MYNLKIWYNMLLQGMSYSGVTYLWRQSLFKFYRNWINKWKNICHWFLWLICWKGMKKLLRKLSRQCANTILEDNWNQYRSFFYQRYMTGFWNCIKKSRKSKNNKSILTPDEFANHFENIMKISGDLTED